MTGIPAEWLQENPDNNIHTTGIISSNSYASVSPDLLNEMIQSISTDELNTLVYAITEAVEDPGQSSLCPRWQQR